ncbi:GTP-binding protein [Polaribacter sp. R77954]|uniref:GTP-binding protein n=1 Tax=Polaribacter sp. R77954 TaxID=3093870 RepID=UPI0037C6F924
MNKKVKILIEKRNSEVFLRPRFTIDLNVGKDEVLQHFYNELQKQNPKISGNIVDGHIFISISKKEDHFWSPQLHLEIVEKTSETALLKGLFGPKPQVWTLFMFIHFIIGFGFLAFCVMLYSRISLKASLFFPILMLITLPLIWILLYFLGKIGKSTGKNQMKDLHNFMLKVIEHQF